MAIQVSFNGVVYTIPETGEESWGENLTDFFVAIPAGALQKSGGAFTLTADVNFGANFGLLSKYFSTRTALPSTAGLVRLAVSDTIGWRNNANGGNLLLSVNASDQLVFNGTSIISNAITALTGDVTATGPGSVAATIAANAVTNAKMATMVTATAKANISGITAVPSDVSLVSAATASTIMLRDTNANFRANSHIDNYATTVTAAGTTVLTVASSRTQFFTGSTTQIVTLPDATTLVLGQQFFIVNRSSAVVTVNGNSGTLVKAMVANSFMTTTVTDISTAAGTWTIQYNTNGASVSSVDMTVPTFLSVSGNPITTSGTLAVTLSGTALPVANGGTAVTSVTTAPTASSFAGWDSNSNLSANNHINGYATTVTAASTTVLTVASSRTQFFTGSTTQIVTLPSATTLPLGHQFFVVNRSSGIVTVNDNSGAAVRTMAASSYMTVTVTDIGSAAGAWAPSYSANAASVNSVAMTVPTFLSISGSPITTSGTLAVSLSGTALPVANGGTGVTTSNLARYTTSAGQSIGAGPDIVDFGTQVYDTNTLVTTGAAWKFTAKEAGKYLVTFRVLFASATWTAAATRIQAGVYKNGSVYGFVSRENIWVTGTWLTQISGSEIVDLAATDFVDVRLQQNEGSGRTLETTATNNHIAIALIS